MLVNKHTYRLFYAFSTSDEGANCSRMAVHLAVSLIFRQSEKPINNSFKINPWKVHQAYSEYHRSVVEVEIPTALRSQT